jgi:hypothetical protein
MGASVGRLLLCHNLSLIARARKMPPRVHFVLRFRPLARFSFCLAGLSSFSVDGPHRGHADEVIAAVRNAAVRNIVATAGLPKKNVNL